ncbi:bacitracin ABC transporter permease [Bacillus manliponensis]|uniref:Bacitracin ABC transporter permease n=1 Tax=Bacillus manliponensis TaxID=574376 RepID=A0A073K068_9BACI|nr:ABC transporter permease [Bacillus manliponensis]KEK19885.1 bacitracin ABC transporter permease [Bacillus manliponensis]
MVNLLYTELLKLKRSKMFLISIIGAAVAPFMIVFASYVYREADKLPKPVTFYDLFYDTNLYTFLVIGIPLYGVVTAYLFNREYAEDTLKNLLTIPVSRISFIMSKFITLFLWIMMLVFVAWVLTLCFGLLGSFDGLSVSLLITSFRQFLIGGVLLFILSTPIILITIMLKNYVPTIIFTIVITMINVMAANSEHRDLFPWSAAGDIARSELLPTYPPEYSYVLIMATSFIGFVAVITYFKKTDIQ